MLITVYIKMKCYSEQCEATVDNHEMSLKWYFGTRKALRKPTVVAVWEENFNNKSHCSVTSRH